MSCVPFLMGRNWLGNAPDHFYRTGNYFKFGNGGVIELLSFIDQTLLIFYRDNCSLSIGLPLSRTETLNLSS